jgi:hypothetical protein
MQTITETLAAFLADFEPSGADAVKVAMAGRLAAAADEAPPYALHSLLAELGRLLDGLAAEHERETSAERVRRLLKPLDGLNLQ